MLADVDDANFRKREWRRILKRADIGQRAIKDLRDTFASQLLTAGVPHGYVSSQLGHADAGVTARHYAKWIEGDSYREPVSLDPGEVPADLLARLGAHESDPSSDPSTQPRVSPERHEARQVSAAPHEKMVELRGIEPLTLRLPERKKGEK